MTHLRGEAETLAVAERLLKSVTTEFLLVAHCLPASLPLAVTAHLRDLAERRIPVRALVRAPSLGTSPPPFPAYLAAGIETRSVPLLPPVLLIADRQAAIMTRPPGGLVTLLVTEPALAEAMATVFDQAWLAAPPRRGPQPSTNASRCPVGTESALLRLLAAGHTDDAAARRLGISLRTVRRQVAAIMTQLEATSRFQAGINAAHRGWVPQQTLGRHRL